MVTIFDHLNRPSYYYNEENKPVSYWEEAAASVDYIVSTGDVPLPFALAFTQSEEDAKQSFYRYMKECDADHGIVVTQDTELSILDDVSTILMWLLLTVC